MNIFHLVLQLRHLPSELGNLCNHQLNHTQTSKNTFFSEAQLKRADLGHAKVWSCHCKIEFCHCFVTLPSRFIPTVFRSFRPHSLDFCSCAKSRIGTSMVCICMYKLAELFANGKGLGCTREFRLSCARENRLSCARGSGSA